jgi:lipase
VRLHVHRYGDPNGPPLVFLHGIAGQGTRAEQLADGLDGRFRVLGPDLRGHGRSSWEPPWGLADHIADVRETVAAEGIESAIFVGHSFGGRIISELDARLVERAVLVDPALHSPPAKALQTVAGWRRASFASVDEAIDHEYREGGLVGAPRALIRHVKETELEAQPDGRLEDRVLHAAVLCGVGEAARPWGGDPPRVPTLVLLGSESTLDVSPTLQTYEELLGDLLTVKTLHAGHSVLWDAPDAALAEIRAFVDR